MSRSLWLCAVCVSVVLATACGGGGKDGKDGKTAKEEKASAGPVEAKAAVTMVASPSLLIAAEDVRTLQPVAKTGGPVIAGSIQPERRADLRAEVSAVVLQVLKDNGEAVRKGDLIVRLDSASIRDNLASAEESARASGQAFEQAERQLQRQKTLQAQGMTSTQALEDAEVRRNNAQSDLIAARARVASARQQLTRTEVRAPFDGVVSNRKASAGDTAQVGKELAQVIDPASMRFEGLVSADRLSEVKVGQRVSFRVNGYPGTDFAGVVKRVDASANATTRQLEVLVSFSGNAPKVAGLYAEGRIESGSAMVLALPEADVLRVGDAAFAWRLKDQSLNKVALKLGERDERSAEVVVLAGLAAGDRVLRRPATTLVDGQKFEWAKGTNAPNVAAAATAVAPTPAASASAGK
jgi:membrane fusion protein, multidrug efflux system